MKNTKSNEIYFRWIAFLKVLILQTKIYVQFSKYNKVIQIANLAFALKHFWVKATPNCQGHFVHQRKY